MILFPTKSEWKEKGRVIFIKMFSPISFFPGESRGFLQTGKAPSPPFNDVTASFQVSDWSLWTSVSQPLISDIWGWIILCIGVRSVLRIVVCSGSPSLYPLEASNPHPHDNFLLLSGAQCPAMLSSDILVVSGRVF